MQLEISSRGSVRFYIPSPHIKMIKLGRLLVPLLLSLKTENIALSQEVGIQNQFFLPAAQGNNLSKHHLRPGSLNGG